jgi:hypothetical protein
MQKVLDAVERVGNRVPHPVMIFVYLIAIVIALSTLLSAVRRAGHLPGLQPRHRRDRARMHRGAQPADGRGHPLHVHRGRANFMSFTRWA